MNLETVALVVGIGAGTGALVLLIGYLMFGKTGR